MRQTAVRPTAVMRLLATTVPRPPPPVVFFYNDVYEVPRGPALPATNSFPMEKYRLVRDVLEREIDSSRAIFRESPLASLDDLHMVHERSYVVRFLSNELSREENRRIGFPWSAASVNRALSSTGGTVAAMAATFQEGGPRYAAQIAGGTHHAYADRGEGYCVFSDIAVAAAVALRDYPEEVRRVLIVDLDVHQGNGNAAIFSADPRVFTFSMHCEANIFSKREASDLDVDLPAGTGDAEYLAALGEALPRAFEASAPDLVFFQSGVDCHASDRFGRLALSSAGLKRRNAAVFAAAAARGSRLVLTMGGGYPRSLDVRAAPFHHVVQAHADCYRQCAASHAAAWRGIAARQASR